MARHPSWDLLSRTKVQKCSPTALRSKNDLRPQRDAAGWYFLAGCQGFVCSHWIGLRPAEIQKVEGEDKEYVSA